LTLALKAVALALASKRLVLS